jgi:type VI secretion system protein ImpG
MHDLLPYFQRELQFLHGHRDDFAARYPDLGGRLPSAGDLVDDPHVERLIQSFALLSSRIHKRLDDDFPLVTESLLEVLYPHYLRPFPSCSLAAFELGAAASPSATAPCIARGTMLESRPIHGVRCRFRTVYDVPLLPLRVAGLHWRGALTAPSGTVLPREATAALSLQLDVLSPLPLASASAASGSGSGSGSAATATTERALPDVFGQSACEPGGPTGLRLRVALAGEITHVDALRTALLGHAVAIYLQLDNQPAWQCLPGLPSAVGFAEDESILESDARVHPAYRLLTELMAFAPKFNFVDLPLPDGGQVGRASRVTLHVLLAGVHERSGIVRQLEQVRAGDVVLGCTPVVNLFAQRADPIRITHRESAYPVLPDGARRPYGFEVYAIDRVFRVQQTPAGEQVHEFLPFFSLRHEHLLRDGEQAGRYWHAHRNDSLAERSPGYETELSIVDIDFNPAQPQTDTLSVQVRATNRDLPSQLSIGHTGGDLFIEGGGAARAVRLLRVPTPTYRFDRGQGALWRLVSHLSLNHLSLSGGGIEALREMLRLYDLPRSASNRRLVDGLVDVSWQADSACVPGNPFPTFVRGVAIRLKVDERAYAGSGLRLLAEGLDRFFSLYVHVNSFTQLDVVSAHSGEVLVHFERRSGEQPLL